MPPIARSRGVAAALCALALLAGCSGSEREAGQSGPPPTPTTSAPAPVAFRIGATDVRAVRAAAELPADARAGVQGVLDRYLATAVVGPLRSGAAAADLSGLFSGPALERVSGPDRAALVDDAPTPVEGLQVGEASADLTALVGPEGVAVMVAEIRLVVTGTADGTPVSVERTGELQLTPEGGGWRISGYDVSVNRSGLEGGGTTKRAP